VLTHAVTGRQIMSEDERGRDKIPFPPKGDKFKPELKATHVIEK